MKSKNREIDFSGQKVYVGIDVHKKRWVVCVMVGAIKGDPFSQDANPQTLVNYLKKRYPGGNYQAVYEAGFCGFWIQKELEVQGVECMVVHPADVPTSHKEKSQKTDKRDSQKLARGLKEGSLTGIHIPSSDQLALRELLRTRNQLVREMTRAKNRIKACLKFRGIAYKGKSENWTKAYRAWLEDFFEEATHPNICYQLELLKGIEAQLKRLGLQLKKAAGSAVWKRQVSLLKTLPGISELSALIFLSEIGDIRRFRTLDQLCSYVGLVPNCYSSGERDRTGSISKRGNKTLKTIIIESSWTAVRKDPALTLAFNKLLKKMAKNRAIIRIAKKLLNRIRYVLMNDQPYVLGVVQ